MLSDAKPLKHGTRVRFHQGTAELLGRVAVIGPLGDPVAPGARGFVRLRLESPAILSRGDRYILRAYSPPVTIAGGVILDPDAPRDGDSQRRGARPVSAAGVRAGRRRARGCRAARGDRDDRRRRPRRRFRDPR